MGGHKRSFSGISSSHSSSSDDWEMNNSGVPTITTSISTAQSRATSAASTKPSSLSSEPPSKKTKTSHEIGENQEDDHDHDSEVRAPRLQVKKVRGWTAFTNTRNNNTTSSQASSSTASASASEWELSDTIKWPGEGPRRTTFTCALCFATRVTHGRPYCRTCTSTLALAHRNPTLTENCIWCFEPLEDILHVVCQKCKDSLRIASSPRKNKSHGADDD